MSVCMHARSIALPVCGGAWACLCIGRMQHVWAGQVWLMRNHHANGGCRNAVWLHVYAPHLAWAQRRAPDAEAALVDLAVRAVEMLAAVSSAAAAVVGGHGSGSVGGGGYAADAELGAAVSGGEMPAAQVGL